jgi:hypothetical protein
MGYSQSWLAVSGKSPETVRDELSLRATGTREDIAESPIVAANLPKGWYLIVADRAQHPLISDAVLQSLAVGCEVLTCTVEEHVMFSAATAWRDGRRVWSVTHESDSGREHLATDGELPTSFSAIRDRCISQQRAEGGSDAAADYIFEVPGELVMSFTGYRHDKDIAELGDEPFEVLEYTKPQNNSWLKRLLSRWTNPELVKVRMRRR